MELPRSRLFILGAGFSQPAGLPLGPELLDEVRHRVREVFAYDKLLGNDPIRDLWQNVHRTLDAYSVIVVIGYSMPAYDGYAYEAIGRLLINYQTGGERTYFDQRRVPLQVITRTSSDVAVFEAIPF